MPSLRVSGISKQYGRRQALDGVSFDVRPSEVLGLIGPNGAGKTTLLECLAGLLPATEGVLLQGDRVLEGRQRGWALFYLPDGIAPWPARPVGWALDFTVGFFGGRAGLRDEVVRGLELEPLLDAPIGSLSKGERKRALLACALLTPQPLLLIDEPFDGLDLRQSRAAARLLREHARAGRTLLLSVHQIADAARLCDRFVLLSGGRVRGEGTLEELQALAGRRADLEEVFLALT
jgi:ABC-2 type transport system ATP-binding protein